MAQLQWSSQPVLAAVDTHLQRANAYVQGCTGVLEVGLGDVASLLVNDPTKGEQLQQAVEQLLLARRSAQLHSEALDQLKASYQASGEVTDFERQLSERAQQLGAKHAYNMRTDPEYLGFLAAAHGEDRGGAGEDERIDDDIAIEGGNNQLAPNATCPITTRPVLDIEDPVQDAQGVVYEKAAIVGYFRSLHPSKHGKSIIMAGSNHEVTLAELVPAERLLREKKRAQRRQKLAGGTQRGTQQQSEDVLDV